MNVTDGRATTGATAEMRAIVTREYGGPEVLRADVVARPTPAAGEVLLQVRAAGLDRGTWHLMTGRPYLLRALGFGVRGPKNPVPGLDVAGTVVAVGADVTRLAVGDEVFGIAAGSFAEYACAKADKLAAKPAALTFEQSAVLGVSGLTALKAVLDEGHVASGQRVLVTGASGGVGSYSVQMAKGAGAEVTGVCSGAKADFVRSLGADHVLDYASDDLGAGGQAYDVIVDTGGNTRLSRLRRLLTPSGTLVVVGGENGGSITGGFQRSLGAALVSPFVGQRLVMLVSKEHYSGLERLAELVEAGTLTPALDRTYPLAQAAEAMRRLESGAVRGKVAITVSADPTSA